MGNRISHLPNIVSNVKALVGTFNQKKALVGAFSVIIKLQEGSFPVLLNSQIVTC